MPDVLLVFGHISNSTRSCKLTGLQLAVIFLPQVLSFGFTPLSCVVALIRRYRVAPHDAAMSLVSVYESRALLFLILQFS